MKKFFIKNKILIAILFVFLFSLGFRYYPIYHKGYPSNLTFDNLILARNYARVGEFSYEDEKGIILASSLVEARGLPSYSEHKLTPFIYSYIFKSSKFNPNLPIYISLILWALTNVLLFFLILRIFNFKLALIFSLIDIFGPLVLGWATVAGSYEFAMVFFILALLFYFYNKGGRGRKALIYIILASIFFGLAGLARSAFLFSAGILIIYDFWRSRSFKRLVGLVIPFLIIFLSFFVFLQVQGVESIHLVGFADKISRYDSHLFPDPYVYFFEKEDYLEGLKETTRNGDEIAFLSFYGYNLSPRTKLFGYIYSLKYYLVNFFRLVTLGGPIIILLAFVGWFYLFKKRHPLAYLTVFWPGLLFIILGFLLTSNEAHFLEIRFPFYLLATLGTYLFFSFLYCKLNMKFFWRKAVIAVCILVLVFHLIQTDSWLFHERYENSNADVGMDLVRVVQDKEDKIQEGDVIAVAIPQAPLLLNYYTDRSYICLLPETIKKVLEEGRSKEVLSFFGISQFLGYDKTLSAEIAKKTGTVPLDFNWFNKPTD